MENNIRQPIINSKEINRDNITIFSGSASSNTTIINSKEINAPLLFTNKSTIGDATNVNNGNFGLQYSENGTDWVDYPITASTIVPVSEVSNYFYNATSPSGATISTFRWQYSNNNVAVWYTKESHKYWRYYFNFRNNNYSSNYWVEAYVPITITTIKK